MTINYIPWNSPASVDPYYSDVVLLLHFDGTDQSTEVVDSSPSPVTAWTVPSSTLSRNDVAAAKYGPTGRKITASGGSISATNHEPRFDLGTIFTVEAWIRLTAYPPTLENEYGLFATAAGYMHVNNGWQISFYARSGFAQTEVHITPGMLATSVMFNTPTQVNLNEWYHVAVTGDGTVFRAFVNGASLPLKSGYSDAVSPMYAGDATHKLHVGRGGGGSARTLIGDIDEVRISTVCRYTASFTPPTAPFPDA